MIFSYDCVKYLNFTTKSTSLLFTSVLRQTSLPLRPVVLEREDAESIWKGLQEAHPVHPFRTFIATKSYGFFT